MLVTTLWSPVSVWMRIVLKEISENHDEQQDRTATKEKDIEKHLDHLQRLCKSTMVRDTAYLIVGGMTSIGSIGVSHLNRSTHDIHHRVFHL